MGETRFRNFLADQQLHHANLIHARVVRRDAALVIVVEVWARGARSPTGCLTVSQADNHRHCLEGAGYVRFIPVPAEDAGLQAS